MAEGPEYKCEAKAVPKLELYVPREPPRGGQRGCPKVGFIFETENCHAEVFRFKNCQERLTPEGFWASMTKP